MSRIVADLHLHSKYSRAVSQRMNVSELEVWARKKGLNLVGTADWTHPLWLKELEASLEESTEGVYKLKPSTINHPRPRLGSAEGGQPSTNFILSTEISSIYSQGGKLRRIHNLVIVPSFAVVYEINEALKRRGANLMSDGRPIIGLSSRDLCELVWEIDRECLIIPCHAWTPWFALYGSKSGFDSLKECYGEFADRIYAVETGLSSSPEMNWRIKELEKRSIVSFSDAHCVHPDSLIFLAKGGISKIKNLSKQERVLSLDFGNDLKLKSSFISKIHKLPAPAYLYQIRTRSWELLATPNHRFFVLEDEKIKEKQAFQLRINDLIACVRKTKIGKKKSVYLSTPEFRQRIKISPKGLKFLRRIRRARGFYAEEIALKISKCKSYMGMIETGKIRSLRVEDFEKMCRLYKIQSRKFCERFKTEIFPKIKTPRFTNKEFCQFLGYALGDGGVERSRGERWAFSLTDKDRKLLTNYQKLAYSLFGIKGKWKKSKSQKSYRLYFPFNLLLFLEHVGVGIFDYSTKRRIPEIIFKIPKYQLAGFLGGFYDAEGTFDHHGLTLCSSNKELLKQIQYFLLKFEILSFIYSDFEKNKKKYRYKLIIYGQDQLKIFNKEIGFSSPDKRNKVLAYLSRVGQKAKDSFKDPLPLRKAVNQLMEDLDVKPKYLPKHLQNFYYKDFKGLKRRNVREFIEVFKNYSPVSKETSLYWKLKNLADSDICWEVVRDLKKIRSNCEFVYDLTVPRLENYIVNGIITHNSPEKLMREATVFQKKLKTQNSNVKTTTQNSKLFSFKDLSGAIKQDKNAGWEIAYTVEFHPEEGKYHYTGHRNCGISHSPEETKEKGTTCPVCGRPLTLGVMHRVEELASDSPLEPIKKENEAGLVGYYHPVDKKRPPYVMLVPLMEILAEVLGTMSTSQRVKSEYENLIENLGSELDILTQIKYENILPVAGEKTAEAIKKVRSGDIFIKPGFDGQFGIVKIWKEEEKEKKKEQMSLF